jgi:hypothetical protein
LEFIQEADHTAIYTSQQVLQHVASYDVPIRSVRCAVGDNTISMVNTLKNIAEYHSIPLMVVLLTYFNEGLKWHWIKILK